MKRRTFIKNTAAAATATALAPYIMKGQTTGKIPNNKIALELLSKFGPITATSANIHGKKPPVNIEDISMQFSKSDIAVYLDDGILDDKPSTIVDLTEKPFKIIRKGAISEEEIMVAISYE